MCQSSYIYDRCDGVYEEGNMIEGPPRDFRHKYIFSYNTNNDRWQEIRFDFRYMVLQKW